MSIKFQSPLGLSAHRAIAHSDSAQTLTVKVVTKTAAHPEYGNGSSSGYIIDNVEGAYIELTPGNTYKFDQSDSSNNGHPLRLYEDAAKTTAYTTGVTTNGTPGTSGAYTQIIPTVSTPPILFYQCSAHSLMGSYIKFGTGSQGDTYTLSATQDGDNVDILLDAGSGTDSTVQLTAGDNITITRNNAQEIEIASSGGGGGELSIERNVFTATANQTAFTISSAITASSNTQVYIDGVYQAKSNYTTSGSTITFSTGVPAGAEVEVVHFISILSKVYTDTFTGDASTVDFTASKDVTDENVTQVYIDGVYQSKDNYATSGTTITFSTAPPSGSAIEVVHFTPAVYSTLNSNQFTGTGSQTDFTLTQEVDEDKSFVFLQGVYQEKSMYSISGTTLTFTTAPQNSYTIEVITVGAVSVFSDTLFLDNFNGTGSQVNYTLSTSPASENAIDVYINGLYQQKNTFSLSGSTLTFSTAPPSGSTIEVKSTGGLNNVLGNVTLTAGTGISITENSNNNFTISNTLIDVYVSWATPTGQGLTYTTPSPQSTGPFQAGSTFPTTTFTVTDPLGGTLSGTAVISGLPAGLTSTQSYNNTNNGNILTITINGVYPSANSVGTNLVISNLTITTPLTVDYLVIAGGGGGGGAFGGGGGSGGYRNSYNSEASGGGNTSETSLLLTATTNYTVTVGAGGTGGTGNSNSRGTEGINSIFSSITSAGGGTGGGYFPSSGSSASSPGTSGGSGGGAGNPEGSTTWAGGAGTTDQGYAGGNAQGQSPYCGGGGGGASAAGANGVSNGGNGGNGLSSTITGVSITRAGGGGGGAYTYAQGNSPGSGGSGGGGNGNGASNGNGYAGTINTGSGGGGSGYPDLGVGGVGGSGVVILRYPDVYTITVPAGLTSTTSTVGTDKVTTFTAGTGNIQFS